MCWLLAALICSSISSPLESQSDPLALQASFQQWAQNLAQKSLVKLIPLLRSPVVISWEETSFYSSSDSQTIKTAFQNQLEHSSIDVITQETTEKTPLTYINLSFLQEAWGKDLALALKVRYQGDSRYYFVLIPVQTDHLEPSAITIVAKKSAQTLTSNWQQLGELGVTAIAFPQIEDTTVPPQALNQYYGSVLATEITKILPFTLDDTRNSAKLTGDVTCSYKNLLHPNRRCNQISLELNLTDAAGKVLWSGMFRGEEEESNINARLRYLENRIASNQTQAWIIGGLGLPLATAGIVIWSDSYNTRMKKLAEGALPGSSGYETSFSVGEYIGIGMTAVGGVGLIYAGQAFFTALGFNSERDRILQAETPSLPN